MGSEGAKFTPVTEASARSLITSMLRPGDVVISGGCHLGGIDQWAAEEGHSLGLEVIEHLPAKRQWEGGYKQRNLKIAQDAEQVICITVKEFPPDYTGMRFPYCYHCQTDTHIKSGGCWTVKQAIRLGKIGEIYVV